MRRPTYILLVMLLAVIAAPSARAQDTAQPEEQQTGSLGFAEYVQISTDGDVVNGAIVSLDEGKFRLTEQSYSTHLYGVVNTNPAVAVSLVGRVGAYPVLSSGTSHVLVSSQNGSIEQGDYITSSPTAGVGMKATEAGFVVGIAQAAFSGESGEQGTVPAAIDIKFVTSPDRDIDLTPRAFAQQIQDVITIGLRAVSSEPNDALRYMAAALVLIASIAFGFLIFGRAATNGVVAVGRNPLAKRTIFVMVVFNITMTVVFAVAGVGLAVVILAL